MKKQKFLLTLGGFIILLTIGSIQSCQKDDDDDSLETTEADAADIVQASLESETGGISDDIALQTEYVTQESEQVECSVDTTITRTFLKTSGNRTGNYTYTWNILKTCTNGDTSFSWTGSFNGTYETPRISGTTSGNRNWSIAGIDSSNDFLTLNGSVSRNGSHTSKVRLKRSFSSEISYQFTDVVVSKQSRQIQSGSGSFQISINASDGNSKTYNGTITFNGNGSATVVINGQTFIFTIY